MTRKQSILHLLTLFASISLAAVLLIQNLPPEKALLSPLAWQNIFFPQTDTPAKDLFLVKRVVDGDTVELDGGEKVRYIGINTPESVDPRRPVQCFGKEASLYNKDLVEGKRVRLERDISDRDKYGRLLRFVYLEDGTFVNEKLVLEGYASVSSYPPDISKQDIFRAAEQRAQSEKRGLWNEATCNGKK